MQLRGPGRATSDARRQFFLAGTAVGFAGLADRARVTRAEVAFAGDAVRAGAVFLAGVPFVGVSSVGLSAGASAPPELVDEVVAALEALGSVTVSTHTTAVETIAFTLTGVHPHDVAQLLD